MKSSDSTSLPEFLPFVIGIWWALLFSWYILLYYLSTQKADEEKGLIPVHTQRCSGTVGLFSSSIGLIRLALYEDFLVIGSIKKLVIPYSQIKQIEKGGLFGNGMLIATTDDDKYGKPVLHLTQQAWVKLFIEKKMKRS